MLLVDILLRSSAIAMSLISLVALAAVVIGSHEHELGVLIPIGTLGFAPVTVWLMVLGVWLYKGDRELLGDAALPYLAPLDLASYLGAGRPFDRRSEGVAVMVSVSGTSTGMKQTRHTY